MVKKEIILKWKKDGKMYSKKVKRRKIFAIFKELAEKFSSNNEISLKMLEIIPATSEIEVNWDNNADVNCIYYTIDGGVTKGIPVISSHKLVWGEMRKLCAIEENKK